jgi:hypothetical protein
MRKVLVATICLLIASSAFAGTITSVNPSSIKINSGEYFITVFGTQPIGNRLIFDGPAGHFEREVSASFTGSVTGWVPEAIVAKAGTHSIKVRSANGAETNSLNFEVVGFKFFPLVLLVPDAVIWQPKTREGGYPEFTVFAVGGEEPDPKWSCDADSGKFFKMGQTVVNCEAWNSKERARASFVVNVIDQVGPIVSVPRDIRVPATSNHGAKVEFSAKAEDEIYGAMPVECFPQSGSTFRVGKTTVSCTSADLDLNIGAGAFVVEVTGDKTFPMSLLMPAPIQVPTKDPRGERVSFDVKVEGTEDPNPEILCSPKSGSLFPLGTTTVNCEAYDRFGSWAAGTFDVSVLDVNAPEIRYAKASPDRIPADGRMWPVKIAVEAVDDLDLQPVCSIIGVTANEPIDSGDDDKDSGDWAVVDALKLELRGESERSRVYNVWVGCSDFFGNLSQANAQVVVTRDAGAQSAPSGRRRATGRP